MIPRRKPGERGFIITIELVLIMTILGIGLLAGIVAVRNALFVYAVKKKAHTVWVYDSSATPKILGPARDFDEHEAPRLFYIDRGVTFGGATRNYRAFIGVRDDRFTTRHRIYYENSLDCGENDTGNPVQECIARSGNESDDNQGVGLVQVPGSSTTAPIIHAGGIGYLYPLQGGPSYGVGREVDSSTWRDANLGLPGTLYRETANPCTEENIGSRWTSQNVGSACELFSIVADVGAAFCPSGRNNSGAEANWCTAENCICWQGGVPYTDPPPANPGSCDPCSCPDGWYRATGINGNNCCPIGTEFDQQAGLCRGESGNLVLAEEVLNPAGDGNALAALEPPFRVNLPPSLDTFELTAAGGFEGAPATPTGQFYDPSNLPAVDFESPDDGIEGSPP